jgi:hypothetical protein
MIPDGLPLSCARACAGGVKHGGLARKPGRGVFVRDQVAALAAIADVQVELFEFLPGALSYPIAAAVLRRVSVRRALTSCTPISA